MCVNPDQDDGIGPLVPCRCSLVKEDDMHHGMINYLVRLGKQIAPVMDTPLCVVTHNVHFLQCRQTDRQTVRRTVRGAAA